VVEDRRFAVLRAIVEDFVSTIEPVGSKALAERHNLGVSPATVRNDMAALEEEGYIAQPHTSAGRVPTDKGYRLFVDRLSDVKPLSAAERRAIGAFLDGAVDLDDVVFRSVRLLAQVTRQVAVVQYPSLTRSKVRHVELVVLTPARLLFVLITDTGRVEQRVVELTEDITEAQVSELAAAINAAVTGLSLVDASNALEALADSVRHDLRPTVVTVLATALEALVESPEERIMLAGASNLARTTALDFPNSIRPVLEALEEQVVLLKLIGEAAMPGHLLVRIGEEHSVEELRGTSTVTTGYGLPGMPLAGLGVVGPTRMNYPATMAAVRAVARYVGDVLSGAAAGGPGA
jgi:heat-inducible transcriptional repressor